jgi:putative DNA primase/helicase
MSQEIKNEGQGSELSPEQVAEIQAAVEAEQAAKKDGECSNGDGQGKKPDRGVQLSDEEVERAFWRNQKGDAELFVKLATGKFIYDKRHVEDAGKGTWYEFTGNYWEQDVNGNVETYVDKVAERYSQLGYKREADAKAAQTGGDKEEANRLKGMAKKFRDRAFSLRSMARIKNVLRLAHSGTQSLSMNEEWDNHPTLFPVANGVVDLETGKLIKGRPDQYMRNHSDVEYHGLNVPAPTWDDLEQKVFCANEPLIDYFRRSIVGTCALGYSYKDLYIAYGPGGDNGKSVLFDTITGVLGGFATTFPVETLLDSGQVKNAGSASPEMLKFYGKRFAGTSEAEQKHRFSMGKVKQICSGGDRVAARELYAKKDIEFRITHTTIVHTNFLPKAAGNDKAFYRRAKILRFGAQFVSPGGSTPIDPEKHIYEAMARDKLESLLRAEASGILAYIVRHTMAFTAHHDLTAPECVLKEGVDYQEDQDLAGRFLSSCCTISPEAKTQMKDIYAAFVKYCIDVEGTERKRVNSQIWLSREMRSKPEIVLQQKKPVAIYGVAIHPERICDAEERSQWKLA